MMKMSPYEGNGSEDSFVASLKEVREARPSKTLALAGEMDSGGKAITTFMRGARDQPFEERKRFYIEARLRDQKDWYA